MSNLVAPRRSRHRSQGCADSPDGSLSLHLCYVDPSARLTASERAFRQTNHFALTRSIFDWAILPIAMALVNLWIVKDGIGRRLSRRSLTQYFCILFQERIHHLGHLACDAPDDLHFSFVDLPSLIVPTHPLRTALLLGGNDRYAQVIHRPAEAGT